MPSSDYRYHGEEEGYADMAEAPRRERESKIKAIAIVAVITVAVLALTWLLIFGSQPALTPEEIVARDDYQGQQPARHIFNLYSLKQDQLKRDAERTKDVADASASQDPIVADVNASEMPANAVVSRSEVTTEEPLREQSYVKAELSRKPVAVISSAAQQTKPSKPEPMVSVLPVYTIKGNQANMRSLPTTDASILQTLNKGQTVTVFGEAGEWVQVAANDGSGISGYIHQSLLENFKK